MALTCCSSIVVRASRGPHARQVSDLFLTAQRVAAVLEPHYNATSSTLAVQVHAVVVKPLDALTCLEGWAGSWSDSRGVCSPMMM